MPTTCKKVSKLPWSDQSNLVFCACEQTTQTFSTTFSLLHCTYLLLSSSWGSVQFLLSTVWHWFPGHQHFYSLTLTFFVWAYLQISNLTYLQYSCQETIPLTGSIQLERFSFSPLSPLQIWAFSTPRTPYHLIYSQTSPQIPTDWVSSTFSKSLSKLNNIFQWTK